jgi:hypothetical protein
MQNGEEEALQQAFNNVPGDSSVFEPEVDPVTWTASEFIAHTKSPGWYAIFAAIAVAFTALVFLFTRDIITASMVIIGAILFGVMASRKPRELSYVVDDHGVRVGEKFYAYANFKSFSLIKEEGVESIWFMPLQRFMPGLSIYFAPEDGDLIVAVLATYLPFEPRTIDPLDKLMHKIGF